MARSEAGLRHDGRLVRMVHVLIHMHLLGGRETSETIARMLGTNPVVIRRMMGALRRAGIVSSEEGRNGGWTLARQLADLSILDIQDALEERPMLAAVTSRDHPNCPVETATNRIVTAAFNVAEHTLRKQLSHVNLAKLAQSIKPQ